MSDGVKIGTLIRETGVTRATIHHYVREGLLPEPEKISRNQALYAPDCVERILLIKRLQKVQRLSLSEVKTLLQQAAAHEDLSRLRRLVEVDSQARTPLLDPARSRESLTRDQLCERTGFRPDQIDAFTETGILAISRKGGSELYNAVNVEVADALAGLAEAGFDEEHGFVPEDVVIYLDGLRSMLHKEITLFLERAPRGAADGETMVQMAHRAIERTTPFLLALRRRLIQEFIEVTPLPTSEDK